MDYIWLIEGILVAFLAGMPYFDYDSPASRKRKIKKTCILILSLSVLFLPINYWLYSSGMTASAKYTVILMIWAGLLLNALVSSHAKPKRRYRIEYRRGRYLHWSVNPRSLAIFTIAAIGSTFIGMG